MTDVITLTRNATTISLPPDLLWSDEFTPWKVRAVIETSLTGALIQHISAVATGRPITLQSGSDFAWVPRSTVEALRALIEDPAGANMTLAIPAYSGPPRTFTVQFRHDETPLEAAPIKHRTPPSPTDWYSITLRLRTVT